MTCDTDAEGIHVGPSGDPERPVAVRLVDDGPLQQLARSDAWRLWSLLQAELVRTLPNPPTYPATPR
ncbi:hypothetical protein LO772_19385 [Yinghuangia sp. ASG 101]|uniref:hypothetical protein n=1 Tax=Yinghuangia sp. ASG 101 TaxID=2896848 RepID=UPI001E632F93|nr:hypothetical protein [Yinghuangia sp. ASG 101]UGQ09121.1 hypothetical protein LO772_19385 [Yinghuangia sp. ASG 101]